MTFAVEMTGIVKAYPGILANNQVDLRVERGQVHALVGENGAGKTTLMKILYGLEQPDAGVIRIDGSEVRIPNVATAIRLGIGMVHQHFMLVDALSVAENVVLGAEPRAKLSFFDKKAAEQVVGELAQRHGMHIDPSRTISDCSVAMRQSTEILKALYRRARILILDEPTAVLTPQEADGLFMALRELASSGVTVIFISHKLEEVMSVADSITVLRNGAVTGDLSRADTNALELARLMIGREIKAPRRDEGRSVGRPVLEVTNLTVRADGGKALVDNVSLTVGAGEIVGVAGVAGNGQSELVEAIAGFRHIDAGRVVVAGDDVTNCGVQRARKAGLGHVPEERYVRGLAVTASVLENVIMGHHKSMPVCSGGLLDREQALQFCARMIEDHDIKCQDPGQAAQSLSGGNLQKIIVARELQSSPKALLVGQPTRGLDVGASEAVRLRLRRLSTEGTGILLLSADLNELKMLSDRILVMYDGRIAGELPPDATQEAIGLLMAGIKNGGGDAGPAQHRTSI